MNLLNFKLEFLWDEEKTRALLKRFVILILVAASPTLVLGFFLPATDPRRVPFIVTTSVCMAVALFSLQYFKKIKNPGYLLLLNIFTPTVVCFINMSVSGGFTSIFQFVPISIIFLTIFQLGAQSAVIVAIFTAFNIIGLYLYLQMFHPTPNLFSNFILYFVIYIVIAIIFNNIGQELSVQIEARKKMEQVDDLKNQFITLTSHYLRTPLTVINGLISELSFSITAPKEQKIIQEIKASTGVLNNLIEKFLAISEIEKGQAKIFKVPSDINQAVASAVEQYQPIASKQDINLFYFPPSTTITRFPFDVVKIKEVIYTLLDNAIKYNKVAGSVKVSLQDSLAQVRIDVSDSGFGISPQHLAGLFTTFNRGNIEDTLKFDRPGFGLSLYLSKLIIEAHGGKIFASSKEGAGSVFTILLPKGGV